MKVIPFLFNFLLVISFLSCQKKSGNIQEVAKTDRLEERIQLVDLNGKQLPLESFKGKTIFLNYWATWCRPCLAEMPDIEKAFQVLGNENFVFIAASDEDLGKIQEFASKQSYTFKFVHSKASVFDMDIRALPTTMVINSEGKIVYNEVGAKDWSSDNELEYLRKLSKL